MNYELKLPENYHRQPLPTKTAWVAALRSGEYQQGRQFLCSDDKYCCLGVLTKLQNRTPGVDDGEASLRESNPLYPQLKGLGFLPSGLKVINNKTSKKQETYDALYQLNDVGNLTFLEIADIIDKVWYDPETEQP